jgi:PAS domain-containing protein
MELEQKNSALDDAQRLIASLGSSMTDVLLVCDIQGHIQQVDQAPEKQVDLDEAERCGCSILTLMAPARRRLLCTNERCRRKQKGQSLTAVETLVLQHLYVCQFRQPHGVGLSALPGKRRPRPRNRRRFGRFDGILLNTRALPLT